MFEITKCEKCVVYLQFALIATSRLKPGKVLKVIFAWLNVVPAGADLGFFIRKSNAEGVRPSRGVRGHAPPKILKSRTSEMPFTAFSRLDSAEFQRL